MADRTKIEWTATLNPDGTVTPGATWNPVRGCSRVSPGCDACYAIGYAHRYSWGEGLTRIRKLSTEEQERDPAHRTHRPDWSGHIDLISEALDKPLRWRKPKRAFVCSGADLFHPKVSFDYIRAVFAVMAACPQHTFHVLTKRPLRMRAFFGSLEGQSLPNIRLWLDSCARSLGVSVPDSGHAWPLPNVWLGTSCEDQQRWDERVVHLMACPAAVRYVSAEPLIGRINVDLDDPGYRDSGGRMLDWLILGGESGGGARPCELEWLRELVNECRLHGIACFVKQLGKRAGLSDAKGGAFDEFPEDLQVREFPT
jgi:protein gp37